MNEQLVPISPIEITSIELLKADQHPVAVYLARLAPRSRIAMASTISVIVRMISNTEIPIEVFPWQSLRRKF
jgi:hypothetical protein